MRRALFVVIAIACVASGVSTATAGTKSALQQRVHRFDFASADTATVHPGIEVYTGDEQCTANFVFTNGTDVFLGESAHCSATGGDTDVNGCTSASLPLGTEITDVDGNRIGQVAYSSWLAMQAANEQDPDACNYNDFALIKLDPAEIAMTNPSVPVFGGPTGVRASGFKTGTQVFNYGNSSLREGLTTLSPHRGFTISELGNGWSHTAYMLPSDIPGDSGSSLEDTNGRAAGVQATIDLQPFALANNFSDLGKMLGYAADHGFPVSLVPGDVPFDHALLDTILG